MTLNFDVTQNEYAIIRDILERLLPPDAQVWVFGSRAKGTARFNSDLDLAVDSADTLSAQKMNALKSAFSEAPISYRVDLVEIKKIEPSFREVIFRHCVRFPIQKDRREKLRFPEYAATRWDEYRLDEVVDVITSGSRDWAQHYSNSGAKFVRMTNIPRDGIELMLSDMKFVELPADSQEGLRTSLNEGDILISITAELGKIGIVPAGLGEAYINQHLALVRPTKNKVVPEFLAQFLATEPSNKRLNRLNDSGAKAGLNLGTIRAFRVNLPTLPEQKKIASFLGVVDAKIAALRARVLGLQTYKRGLMQALFSQTLRFTKPDGTAFPDWEEKRLGEVATRCKAKNGDLQYMRVLTNSAVQGVVDQGSYFDKDIANAENLGGYYIVKLGDFVYNPRISVTAPVGPIKRNDLGDGVMSPLYTVFRFKEANSDFFNTYFETTFWHDYMKSVANYGARHDRMAISMGDFMDMPLPFPHPDEQAKIAEALSAMDAKIAAVQGQVDRMQDFKKGLLQQMFV